MKYHPAKPGALVLLMALAGVCLNASPCAASEGGIGAYWPGYRNYLAGIVPPDPGYYLREDVVGYTATAPRVVLNGHPVRNASANVVVDTVEPSYVFAHKILGAAHAVVLTTEVMWDQLSGNVIGTSLTHRVTFSTWATRSSRLYFWAGTRGNSITTPTSPFSCRPESMIFKEWPTPA